MSGNLGVGTSSPSTKLDVEGTGVPVEINSSNSNTYKIQFADNGTVRGYIGSSSATPIRFADSSASELMRIDSSGNLLVGKTATGISNAGISVLGGANAGTLEVRRDIATANSSSVGYISRGTSDGNILTFYKDTSSVGSIGHTGSGGACYIAGSNNVGLQFNNVSDEIRPCNSDGSARDNAIDLGNATRRFKDLYLGGGLYVGGTGSANKLDDYEEGTWTPTFFGSTTAGTYTFTTQLGHYRKIGNVVHAAFNLININTSSAGSGGVQIGGLPFASKSGMAEVSNSLWLSRWDISTDTNFQTVLEDNSSVIRIKRMTSGASGTGVDLDITDKPSNLADIYALVTYFTN